MANEFDIKIINPKSGDTVIRPTKPLVVKDVRGSLEVESTDWATLARAVKYCAGTGIKQAVPYIHVADGHGYVLEELDPENVPYMVKEGPVADFKISDYAIVSYNISRDSKPQLTGEMGEMAVATRAQEVSTASVNSEQVVNLNIAFRERQASLPSVVDGATQIDQEAWARSLLDKARNS